VIQIFVMTTILMFGGERQVITIQVPSMDRCYDMAEIELQRRDVEEVFCSKMNIRGRK
jgi:hypothetical protein